MIPTPQGTLKAGHATHPGETGKNNEDRYALAFYRNDSGEPVTLAIIADGIGGNRAGEVAAEMVVKAVISAVEQSSGSEYSSILNQAMSHAALAVYEAAAANPHLKGMGSTCAAALVVGRRLYTAYIGDSRIYILRRGGIVQASVDHTFVQEAIELGLITAAEARTHPHRHVVRRHLGGDPAVKADFRLRLADDEPPEHSMRNQGLLLDPGSMLFLCSDGLSDLVEADEIFAALSQQAPQAAAESLVLLARQRGGHDNITVIILQV
jgi:PPM family protein phosphatase